MTSDSCTVQFNLNYDLSGKNPQVTAENFIDSKMQIVYTSEIQIAPYKLWALQNHHQQGESHGTNV